MCIVMSHSRGEKFNREFSDLLLIHCYLIIYKLFPELQHCGPLWVPSSHHTNCLLIYSLISNKKIWYSEKKNWVDMRSCMIAPYSLHLSANVLAISLINGWRVSEILTHSLVLMFFLWKKAKLGKGLLIALWSIHNFGF